MWKQIFIMLTCANINMKRTWQVYGAISCLKIVLNKLKETRGPTFIIPFVMDTKNMRIKVKGNV
jgi:hypothetical protein